MTDRDAQMVSEFTAGREVPEIAARYAVPEAYVDRLIEEASTPAPPKRAVGITNWGNRLLLAFLGAWLLWLVTRQPPIGIVGGLGVFILLTVLAERRK